MFGSDKTVPLPLFDESATVPQEKNFRMMFFAKSHFIFFAGFSPSWNIAMPDKTTELETPADLAAWAKDVAGAVTPAELARLVKDYREQAQNSRRSEADREFAKRRGNALAKFVKQTS